MKTTIGGDRLGSGNKQTVSLRNYERSTHDLSYIWRSSASAGTLIPFMTEVGLPGDTFDIDLNVNVLTHPTIGPLFGSYKIQLDVFSCPMRLYNGELHMNKLGIGMNMKNVKIPQIRLEANSNRIRNVGDNSQINASCIFSYLNIRGIGLSNDPETVKAERDFNAIPYLAYWDIYKNYYSNKMEEKGAVIHNPMNKTFNNIETWYLTGWTAQYIENYEGTYTWQVADNSSSFIILKYNSLPIFADIKLSIFDDVTSTFIMVPITSIYNSVTWDAENKTVVCSDIETVYYHKIHYVNGHEYEGGEIDIIDPTPQVEFFNLTNIDQMRQNILTHTGNASPFIIKYIEGQLDNTLLEPYNLPLMTGNRTHGEYNVPFCKLSPQEGLALKTYQSDLFNNWLNTEWIDGENGINDITSVDTTGGSFTIDTLNLANKVYNMLNRIALSGGTYDDWLDAVYTHERARSVESPMYMGGLIRELTFEEVISLNGYTNNEGEGQPLGTLAGRGKMTNKVKGGNIRIRVDEPSYIMGIFSLTPRLDYSQGNKWDVNLKTMDDFHKPALDEIGFQDLVTDTMAWWDTRINDLGATEFKSAGKQPAWINYMTNVNQVRGSFAEKNDQMWMTLNRRYDGTSSITDLTTYIDPAKFNYIFADTALDAQNFWVQIGNNITARRKMSAKIIPNL